MGATTKSISGLFIHVCGRITRKQIAAGHGTRSAATQGYLSFALSCLGHFSWSEARDQARWHLKRLGGQLSSVLRNNPGILLPARCPASPRPEAFGPGSRVVGRHTSVQRFHG